MLSIDEASRIIEVAYKLNPGSWVAHSRNVANLAQKMSLKAGLNSDKAYVLGLLHDIGRRNGVMQARHIVEGYKYMLDKSKEVARVCLTHTFQYKNIAAIYDTWDCPQEDQDLVQAFLLKVEYDDYDRLIQFCDAVSLADGYCMAEQKMVRSVIKFGFNEVTILKWKAILALKEYWDQKTGEDVYALI